MYIDLTIVIAMFMMFLESILPYLKYVLLISKTTDKSLLTGNFGKLFLRNNDPLINKKAQSRGPLLIYTSRNAKLLVVEDIRIISKYLTELESKNLSSLK